MKRKTLFRIELPYRGSFDATGFSFGEGEKSVCIVGAMRGNEVQQLFLASQLVRRLAAIEREGGIAPSKEILVVPTVNHISTNVGKRFWAADNTDINRMFPGYDQGETTQRIAAGLFEAVRGYAYGIQFPSFYLEGDFLPHVRYMRVEGPTAEAGDLFGLRYVVARTPMPFDTGTLNYNWRLWDTDAYSVYTGTTDRADTLAAREAARGCLRFMARVGAIDYPCDRGYLPAHFDENVLVKAFTTRGGFLRRLVGPGDTVEAGSRIAEVISALDGETVEVVRAPVGGIVFFACSTPLVTEHTVAFTIVPRGADCA